MIELHVSPIVKAFVVGIVISGGRLVKIPQDFQRGRFYEYHERHVLGGAEDFDCLQRTLANLNIQLMITGNQPMKGRMGILEGPFSGRQAGRQPRR